LFRIVKGVLLGWLGPIILFGVVAACGSAVNPANLGPRELVVAYYASLEKGDTSAARSDLAPSLAGLEDSSPDSDFTNLQTITNVVVGRDEQTGTAGTSFERYVELREMAVTFDAVYKQVITADSGRQTRFVIVGRLTTQSPWQIVSIGSGP
jgi:hypothetical protein